jgi:hypothetical protein
MSPTLQRLKQKPYPTPSGYLNSIRNLFMLLLLLYIFLAFFFFFFLNLQWKGKEKAQNKSRKKEHGGHVAPRKHTKYGLGIAEEYGGTRSKHQLLLVKK